MSEYSAVAPPPQQNFNQSSAFAAALQRAKQIAAKINPNSTGSDSRGKRPLEDAQEPEAKKGPGVAPPNQGPPSLGRPPNQGGMGSGNGKHTEDMKVPDKMVGLIIGRGGDQIMKLSAESGCKIQLAPDSQGMPDRICTLTGSLESIQRAKELITNLISKKSSNDGAFGNIGPPGTEGPQYHNHSGMNNMNMGGPGGRSSLEIMIPGPKVGLIIGKGGETIKQLQEKSGAKMVVIQDGPNQEHEKPLVISGDPAKIEHAKQLVYDLIAEKEMKSFNRRSGGGGGPRHDNRQQDEYNEFGGNGGGNEIEVLVPKPAVGVVIGKGGDMIKKIQAETGARVQFQQNRDEGPGDRRCYLSGNPKQVEQARMRIEELIDSVLQRDGSEGSGGGGGAMGGGGMGSGMRGGRGGGRGGRGGGHMGGDRFDRNRNGGGGGGDFGGNQQWEDRSGGGGGRGGSGGHHPGGGEVSFMVPANKCGIIIGRGGETIKQINAQSGAYCELDRRTSNQNPTEKTFIIRGDPDQIEAAKRIIQEKVQIPLNFVMSGGPSPMSNNMPTAYPGMAPQAYNPQSNWGVPGGYQQQQWGAQQGADQVAPQQQVNVNPSTGQPDYSLQWAEYYRSLGMHREAEMIEQQAKAKQAGGGASSTAVMPQTAAAAPMTSLPTATPTAAAPGGAAGQPDYSPQWAEYYRSIGKLKEAEAIEAQMKSKNPSAQPAAAAATGTTGTAATGQAAAGGYQQPYGAYQPPAGYYGGQPQGVPVPTNVPQGGYGFPSYSGYGQQNAAPPNQDN